MIMALNQILLLTYLLT